MVSAVIFVVNIPATFLAVVSLEVEIIVIIFLKNLLLFKKAIIITEMLHLEVTKIARGIADLMVVPEIYLTVRKMPL